jgi:hypothetical protein
MEELIEQKERLYANFPNEENRDFYFYEKLDEINNNIKNYSYE